MKLVYLKTEFMRSNVFNKDKDAMRQSRAKKEKYHFEYLSMDCDTNGTLQIADPDGNVEDKVIHDLFMEQLLSYLSELKAEDRDFLHDCFDSKKIPVEKVSEKYHLTKKQIYHRRNELVKYLRCRFDEKSNN